MITDKEDVREALKSAQAQEPKEFWEEIGIDFDLAWATAIAGSMAAAINGAQCPPEFVAASMQVGAVLARAGLIGQVNKPEMEI